MAKKESLKAYKHRIDDALGDSFLRKAMDDFAVAYRVSRKDAFSGMDLKKMTGDVATIKAHAIRQRRALLAEFTKRAEDKGVHIHMAKDAEEANSIITRIANHTRSRKIVKSKSMTSEEIHLNEWLENHDYEVTETDLGEWIVQLRREGPSHMVMPAIHLSRHQVADLFTSVTKKNQDPEIQRLVKVARKQLREKFIEADMGITGANYLIAKTGTIGIVTNEGNARLVTTLPRVHVVLAGIDKFLPSLSDALTINRVLPKNATGQAITTYVTWITGPSKCSTCKSGKREMHVVLLDNGRSKIANDPVFASILQCVRCGACANVCPVYRMVGGHRMGHIYIGAMGLIATYFFHGREYAKNLVKNCTNCGACRQVCAAGIDLPSLIKDLHARILDEEGHPLRSLLLGKVLKNRKLFHSLLKTARMTQGPVTGGTPYLRHLPMVLSPTHNFRVLPAIAKTPFRDRFKNLVKNVHSPVYKIAIFAGCVQDFVYPGHIEAAMRGFKKNRVNVVFPTEQTCCGLPAVSMGETSAARDVALQNIEAFAQEDVDYIITLCASCASHLKHGVPKLVKGYADEEAQAFASKVLPFSQFMGQVVNMEPVAGDEKKVAFHSPCHLCRGLGIKKAPQDLIKKSGNLYIQTPEEETCCGFGGSFSADFPRISGEILTRKLDDVKTTGAELLVTECPGCVMQLQGGAIKQNRDIKVAHIAELLYP